jgi:hypothetical protein
VSRQLAGLKPWKPGQSGNPSGRPKATHNLLELTRTYTNAAVATLAEIMQDRSEPGTTRIAAANALLDRAWGKPLQTVSGPDGQSPLTMHLLAAQLISQQDIAASAAEPPPTIQHEPINGNAANAVGQQTFDLNAPPPSE